MIQRATSAFAGSLNVTLLNGSLLLMERSTARSEGSGRDRAKGTLYPSLWGKRRGLAAPPLLGSLTLDRGKRNFNWTRGLNGCAPRSIDTLSIPEYAKVGVHLLVTDGLCDKKLRRTIFNL